MRKSDGAEGMSREFRVRRKRRSIFPVECTASNVTDEEGNVVGRMASFVDITKPREVEQELRRRQEELEEAVAQRTKDLQDALAEADQLRGLLPICSSCRKIRNEQGDWVEIEAYVSARSEAALNHGSCPACTERQLGKIKKEAASSSGK